MKLKHIPIILLIILMACQPKDDDQELTPIVNTLTANIGDHGGINLYGSYERNGIEISKIGFEFSTDSLFRSYKTVVYEVTTNPTNQINYFVTFGIEQNIKYYYRTFLQTLAERFFGETKSIVSDGSVYPEIASLSSDYGHIADTLTIHGHFFKDPNYQTLVLFSSVQASVLLVNDSVIKCTVPSSIKTASSEIQVKINNRIGRYESFTLYKPTLTTIDPLICFFGDTITISGDHFDFEISRNKVFFGNVQAQITHADRNKIEVIIPENLEKSIDTISVSAQVQQITHNKLFQLLPPQIKVVPESAVTNENITIKGSYFHPNKNKNTVTFENIEATIISGDKENLTVKVPRGPYPRRMATIKIQLLDMVVEYDLDLKILDKWIMVSNDLPFNFYRSVNGAVVANNEAYIITGTGKYTDTNFYLWKFNPENYSWTKYTLPFQPTGWASAESNGEKIYVYSANKDNAFWEFNPVNQQWTKRSQFPGARRDFTIHFSINGDIYMGSGVDIHYSQKNYRDVYKYSPSLDTWSRIADFPHEEYSMRIEMSNFVINNIAYVGNGATNTGATDFWSYLPQSNEWKQIADFPDARTYTASFVLNDLGYVTGGTTVGGSATKDCWIYNPSLHRWSKTNNIGYLERSMHFAFSLNGRGYIGGGGTSLSGGDSAFDLFEYVP